jgi:uncharacterized damage-inducible protein DinB
MTSVLAAERSRDHRNAAREELACELARELATTRKLLERLPDERLGWKPHPKSFTAGALACHLIDCVRWVDAIFGGNELDFDPRQYRPTQATSVAELLANFDDRAACAQLALAGAADGALAQPWRFKILGRPRFEKPRAIVLRDFTLSHLIHHRGQLSVYLRLLEVPVPGAYGPSADEQG